MSHFGQVILCHSILVHFISVHCCCHITILLPTSVGLNVGRKMLFFFARSLWLCRLKACYIFLNVVCRLHILSAHQSAMATSVGVAVRPPDGPAHNSTAIANCDCGFVCTFPASDEVGPSSLEPHHHPRPRPRPSSLLKIVRELLASDRQHSSGVLCRWRVWKKGARHRICFIKMRSHFAFILKTIFDCFCMQARCLGADIVLLFFFGMFCGPHNH